MIMPLDASHPADVFTRPQADYAGADQSPPRHVRAIDTPVPLAPRIRRVHSARCSGTAARLYEGPQLHDISYLDGDRRGHPNEATAVGTVAVVGSAWWQIEEQQSAARGASPVATCSMSGTA